MIRKILSIFLIGIGVYSLADTLPTMKQLNARVNDVSNRVDSLSNYVDNVTIKKEDNSISNSYISAEAVDSRTIDHILVDRWNEVTNKADRSKLDNCLSGSKIDKNFIITNELESVTISKLKDLDYYNSITNLEISSDGLTIYINHEEPTFSPYIITNKLNFPVYTNERSKEVKLLTDNDGVLLGTYSKDYDESLEDYFIPNKPIVFEYDPGFMIPGLLISNNLVKLHDSHYGGGDTIYKAGCFINNNIEFKYPTRVSNIGRLNYPLDGDNVLAHRAELNNLTNNFVYGKFNIYNEFNTFDVSTNYSYITFNSGRNDNSTVAINGYIKDGLVIGNNSISITDWPKYYGFTNITINPYNIIQNRLNYIILTNEYPNTSGRLVTESYVDTHKWDYQTQITNIPTIEVEVTNSVTDFIKTGIDIDDHHYKLVVEQVDNYAEGIIISEQIFQPIKSVGGFNGTVEFDYSNPILFIRLDSTVNTISFDNFIIDNKVNKEGSFVWEVMVYTPKETINVSVDPSINWLDGTSALTTEGKGIHVFSVRYIKLGDIEDWQINYSYSF